MINREFDTIKESLAPLISQPNTMSRLLQASQKQAEIDKYLNDIERQIEESKANLAKQLEEKEDYIKGTQDKQLRLEGLVERVRQDIVKLSQMNLRPAKNLPAAPTQESDDDHKPRTKKAKRRHTSSSSEKSVKEKRTAK